MSQRKWLGAIIVIALSGSTAAYAIENASGDRDTSRGSNWRSDDRAPQDAGRGYYYQDNEMRARHQRARDDDAERRYSRDFDVQGRMNN